MTRVVNSIQEWKQIAASPEYKGRRVGFVPTMGAIHRGHLALVEQSRKENEISVVSIFVNPTQFDNPEDLHKYPRPFDQDRQILESAAVDYLFSPDYHSLYPDEYRYRVQESALSKELCGRFRPGHFDGVLTVVMKLLQLVQARHAYFGEKDHQQYLLVKGMAEAFFLTTEICSCPTVREDDGLAMSSRNVRLSPDGRKKAAEFARLLRTPMNSQERLNALQELGSLDYVEERLGRRFGAIHIDGIRLIDNLKL